MSGCERDGSQGGKGGGGAGELIRDNHRTGPAERSARWRGRTEERDPIASYYSTYNIQRHTRYHDHDVAIQT